jgi:hypothetical protein
MIRSAVFAAVLLFVAPSWVHAQSPSQPAATAFERLKALEGEWVDAEGIFGKKGAVAVTYKVTGGGTSVVETFPVGTPGEMVTVYHKDGDALVLTHYCSNGTQPRMRAATVAGDVLSFDFDGGTNIDPTVTSHMHAVTFEFLGPDEIRATWQNWQKGRSDHAGVFRVTRGSRLAVGSGVSHGKIRSRTVALET